MTDLVVQPSSDEPGPLSSSAPYRPWTEHYPEGLSWDAPLDIRPVADRVLEACETHASRVALDFIGAETTYEQLGATIRRLTAALQTELGVRKGTRVALLLPNTPYYVFFYYAVLRAGGTVVNCNPLYSMHELRHIVSDSEAEIIVTIDVAAVFEKADALVQETGVKSLVVCSFPAVLPGVKSLLYRLFKRKDLSDISKAASASSIVKFRALMQKGGTPAPVEIDLEKDVAVQQYTGGTTGIPKGAMLTHKSIAANLAQIDIWQDNAYAPGQGLIAVLPFFHIFSMTTCLNSPLARGMELLLLPRFEIKMFLDLIARKRPQHLKAVPTLLHTVAANRMTKKYDLTCIEYVVVGGAATPKETADHFRKIAPGAVIVEGYGLTEASPVVCCQPFREDGSDGSVGPPFPGTDLRIVSVDNPREDMALGERGEILVSGPQLMVGYYKDHEATKAVFVDNWLRTGDVGYLDKNGRLHLVDRIKDLIISSGYNVYPRHIEDALYKHPDVEEASVIGVPDARRGETPVAYVQKTEGSKLDTADLKTFLGDYLSKVQMPREIIFKEELPKTLVGKLSKKELREDYEARRTGGQAN